VSAPLGRILIVDDDPPVREVLAEFFTSRGYAVEPVADGLTALAAVERARPDLVLLDVRMPGLDGVEVLRRIRALDAAVPVIMVTANEDAGLARETLKIGAFDYIEKPFDFTYLDRAVAASLLQASQGAAPAWASSGPRATWIRRPSGPPGPASRALPSPPRWSRRRASRPRRPGTSGRSR
jgi:two-component system response regulator (stage 0 sporulation protein F)